MTADRKAARRQGAGRQIKADLTRAGPGAGRARVTPGLGTVLVGDDPGSRSYVAGKHRDCQQVGIASIQVELPAATCAGGAAGQDRRAERRPGLHRLPGADPAARQPRRRLGAGPGRPGQGRRRPAPDEPRPAGARGARARCRAPRGRSSNCCGATASTWPAGGVRDRTRHDRRPPARSAAQPQERERDGDLVPHRDRRPGRPHPARPTSSSRRPVVPVWSPPTWSSPERSASTSGSPAPSTAWSATWTSACARSPRWWRRCPAGSGR